MTWKRNVSQIMLRLVHKRQIRVFDNGCHISTVALKVIFQDFQNKRSSSRQRERTHTGERAREKNFLHQTAANRSDEVSRWTPSPEHHLHCSRSSLKLFFSCSNYITFISNYSNYAYDVPVLVAACVEQGHMILADCS